jgi:hypothetical protein
MIIDSLIWPSRELAQIMLLALMMITCSYQQARKFTCYIVPAMNHLRCHKTSIRLHLVALEIHNFQAMSFHPKSFHPNVQFFNTFAALPATAPANHAHIIDFGKTGTSPAMLQDAVVTLLYSISPETLTAFLKPDITSFRLLQKHKDPKHVDKFIVMKKGSKVLVSVLT